MNKKVGIALMLLAVVLAGAAVWLVSKDQQAKSADSKQLTTVEPTAVPATIKEYRDPAGFLFQYPDTLTVTVGDGKDSTVYSQLTLTTEDGKGDISITVHEKKAEVMPTPTSIKKVKLGALDAEERVLDKRVVTVATDQGVTFEIAAPYPLTGTPWEAAYQKILSSFDFYQPETVAAPATDSGGAPAEDEVVFEGEEIIQ